MSLLNIYSGSWVPRTVIHLEEFSSFLKFGAAPFGVDKEKLSDLRKLLSASDVVIEKGKIDRLTATMSGYQFNYLDDGTMLVTTETTLEELAPAFHNLTDFYLKKILTAYSCVYSKGSPIPKSFESARAITPSIITADKLTPEQISSIFDKLQDKIVSEYKRGSSAVYFGEYATVIVGESAGNIEVVRHFIFLRDFKDQLERLLHAHRQIWDEITAIREKETVHFSDLPNFRDSLLNLSKDISFFKSRLAQMDLYIKKRMNVMEDVLGETSLKQYIEDELSSLFDAHEYFTDLWEMTDNYANSTFELITFLYQENEQKEINVLQVIFIIGVLASLLTLGAMPGANLTFRNAAGQIIGQGQLESFSLVSFLQFGSIAFITSVVVYYILHFSFTRLKKLRVVDKAIHRAHSMESIFKYLK